MNQSIEQNFPDQCHSVNALNFLLRGEMSACESYRIAIHKMKNAQIKEQLEQCELNHRQRVKILRDRIWELRGDPVDGPGAWGTLIKMLENGASLLGDKAAVALLEQGEEHGVYSYADRLDDLDFESRQLVRTALLPAQEQTQIAMSCLRYSN